MLQRNNCVICNKTEFVDIHNTDKYPLLFTLLEEDQKCEYIDINFIGCLNCGCVQLKELAEPTKLYKDSYNVTCNNPTIIRHFNLFSDFILKNIIYNNEIYEIGGSNGKLAQIIKSKKDTKYIRFMRQKSKH